MRHFSVALVSDLLEENWPSMDLVSEMLYTRLALNHSSECKVSRLRPEMKCRLSRSILLGKRQFAWNADRLINRFVDYPLWIGKYVKTFDVFHVIDHSYAQLVHQLPSERTVISCHDLDTFKCLFNASKEKRSMPFRLMIKRVLDGFCKASRILCDSATVRDELLSYGIVRPEKVSVVFHGIHPSCSRTENPPADALAERLLGVHSGVTYLLHVGSTIPRKGINTLLRVFATVRKSIPAMRLVRVGGGLTNEQQRLAAELNVLDAISVMPHLDREVLASIYRRASVLLLPSDAEGFGLPLIEAMACGCPVIASDIPVLREIGGRAVEYCGVTDVEAWSQRTIELNREMLTDHAGWEARRAQGAVRAGQFTWEQSAAKCVEVYKKLLKGEQGKTI